MQAAVSLLSGVTAWLLQEAEQLQLLHASLLCRSVADVIDKALLLTHTALFSQRYPGHMQAPISMAPAISLTLSHRLLAT